MHPHPTTTKPTAPRRHPLPPLDQGTRAPHPLVVRLVEYRQAKGWTQEEAAERLQIPLNTLRGYECGNRNPGGANTEKILTLVGLPKRRSR